MYCNYLCGCCCNILGKLFMNLNLENLFSVKDKVGIVTGGSRGIGEMIASGFLANKAKVYITARKEEALLDKAKELSDKFDTECIPFVSDLSNLDGIKKFKVTFFYVTRIFKVT